MVKTFVSYAAVVLVVLGVAVSVTAKEKETKASKTESGTAFDGTGTVTKYTVGICMIKGVKYTLHPKKGDAVHLGDGHKHDLKVLEDATKSGGWVRVEGTWDSGAECKFVKVSKAMPVK